MTDIQRIRKTINWLIFKEVAENERALAELLGYTKSSFSQIVNGKVPLSELGLEAELAVTEFNHSLRPYRFGEGERFAVLLLVCLCPLGDEVQVQVFV